MRLALGGLALLLACGNAADVEAFTADYEDTYCARFLGCPDPVGVFDGTQTEEACRDAVGPELRERAESCDLDLEVADQCLGELETALCPGEDEAFDTIVPPSCNAAWLCDP